MAATVVISAVLVGVVGLIVRSIYKDKKNGKSSCGGGCGGCPGRRPTLPGMARGGLPPPIKPRFIPTPSWLPSMI